MWPKNVYKCDDNQISFHKGERRNFPFCRSPQIYNDEPKFQTQFLMFAVKVKRGHNVT